MGAIQKITEVDFATWVITAFLILSIVIAGYEIFTKFLSIIGKPVGVMKQRKADHELLIETVKELKDLRKKHNDDNDKSIKEDNKISADLKKLTEMFVDKEIDDYRWEIINFATRIAEGRPCNRDSYKHCLRTYEKYEKLLEENGLENGEVEISMEIINESYKKKLIEGF